MSSGPLRVDVVGDPGLCPAEAGIERRAARAGGPAPAPPADVVIVDLDGIGERGIAAVRRTADPRRGVVVLAISRDPARAGAALAAGASDFALLPRDAGWLAAAVRRERDRRRSSDRLVLDIPPAGLSYEEYEGRIVEHALERAGWNRSRAARELGISRPRLLRKIERHALSPPPDPGAGRR